MGEQYQQNKQYHHAQKNGDNKNYPRVTKRFYLLNIPLIIIKR